MVSKRIWVHAPVSMLQSLAVRSQEEVTTQAVWPAKVWVHASDSMCRRLAVRSLELVNTEGPSPGNTVERT